MKVQKIANTSIFTRKNDSSSTVSFSGKNPRAGKNAMPRYSAKLAKGAEKKPDTVLEELTKMAKGVKTSVKQSFEKSEINNAIVKPAKEAWNNFAKKAPTLSRGIKATACVAIGVGLFEAVKGKISE